MDTDSARPTDTPTAQFAFRPTVIQLLAITRDRVITLHPAHRLSFRVLHQMYGMEFPTFGRGWSFQMEP